MQPDRAVARQRVSRPGPLLLNNTDILREEYVYKLTNGQLTVRFWIMKGQRDGNTTTLSFIPQRLGESKALDDAVKCICSTPSPDFGDDSITRRYLRALGSLQKALNNSIESMSSGTLAAATLLYIHEIFSSPFQQGWMVHADGVIKLIEARGPDTMNTELDKSILCGQAGTIFLNAVQRCKPCFLAESRWNTLLRQLSASRQGVMNSIDATPSITSLSVYLPGMLCSYEHLSATAEPTELLELMKDISCLQLRLREWRSVNDILNFGPDYNTEITSASTDALNCAFRLSSVMFLILSTYMYVDLADRRCATFNGPGEDNSQILKPRIDDSVVESIQLARIAEVRWQAVTNVDAVAAWACGATNIMLFSRALNVAHTDSPAMRIMRRIVERLHKLLNEND